MQKTAVWRLMHKRILLFLTVIFVATSALVPACAEASEMGTNRPAPAYEALYVMDEGIMNLHALRGNPVLLYSWATWCTVCPTQTPKMEELYREYGPEGLHLIGVNLDTAASERAVYDYLLNAGVSFPNVADKGGNFMRAFQTFGVPDSILIDRDGNIVHHWSGAFDPFADTNRALIEAVIAGDTLQNSSIEAPEPALAVSTILVAFGGGLLSFFSPCLLPLIPAYVAFIGGASLKGGGSDGTPHQRHAAFVNGLFFVAGFSLIFVTLGASAGLIGDFLHNHRAWIARIGGVFLLLLGLQMLGVFTLPGLSREARFTPRRRPAGYGSAFIVGLAFAAGWSPCVGPVLAGILTLAASKGSAAYGVILLATYASGLAIPFLAVTLSLDRFLVHSRRINRWLPLVERVSGVLILIVAGVLLTGTMSRLIQLFI